MKKRNVRKRIYYVVQHPDYWFKGGRLCEVTNDISNTLTIYSSCGVLLTANKLRKFMTTAPAGTIVDKWIYFRGKGHVLIWTATEK